MTLIWQTTAHESTKLRAYKLLQSKHSASTLAGTPVDNGDDDNDGDVLPAPARILWQGGRDYILAKIFFFYQGSFLGPRD